MTDKRKGLKPKGRKLATPSQGKKLTGNQWQNTPQQNLFMGYWLDPNSETFSNAYASALRAKYSPHYAVLIAAPTTANKWIKEYLKNTVMDGEHVKQGLQDIYLNPKTYNNSRSPADTRLKALELLGKVTGIINDKGNSMTVNVVQPILAGESVSSRKVDVDITTTLDPQ